MFSGDGFSEESFSVNDHVEPDNSAFQAFLARVSAPRVWLLEIDALSLAVSDALGAGFSEHGFSEIGFSDDTAGGSGGLNTLRYSTHGWTRREYGYADYLALPGVTGNYASTPDSVNAVPSQNWCPHSEDMTAWLDGGAITVTANAYADPLGNLTIDTLTDDSAAGYEAKGLFVTVPDDSSVWRVGALVRKDVAATQRCGFNLSLSGGTTPVSTNARFALDGTNISGCTVTSYDTDYWFIEAIITNNTTGNVTLAVNFYPATSATKGGADNVAGVGSMSVGWVRFQRSARALPYYRTTGTINKGQYELEIDMAPDDWTPAAYKEIVSKKPAGTEYLLRLNTSGALTVFWGTSISVFGALTSTTALAALSNEERRKIKVQVNSCNASNQSEAKFWQSADGGQTWTQIGSTVTGSTSHMYFEGGNELRLGFRTAGAGLLTGKGYSFKFRPIIDGPETVDFNPRRDARPGATSFVSSTTGETWTINQSGANPALLVAGGEVGLHYDGRIKDGFTVSRDLAGRDGVGGLARVFAEVPLSNADGALDGLLQDFALDGRAVRLLVGAADADYSEFGTVFSGVVKSATITQSALRLSLSDGLSRLEVPIQANRYAGSGGLEGGADLKGKNKPLCYGAVFNVTPVLVDPLNLVWQVHDGAIQDVPAVRDRAVALTKVSGTPAAGEYSVNAAAGTFQLGASPDGEVTCDVEGDAPVAGYSDQLATIALRILAAKLYTSEIDTTAFSNVGTMIAAPVGVWVGTDDRTAADVLDELLFGAGCYGGFSRAGVFTAGLIAAPNAGATVLELDETSITTIDREPLPAALEPAVWRAAVAWRRNHSVQSDIAALAADADRAFAVEEWRYAAVEDAAVKSRHLLAREYGPIPSPFVEQADGDAEAARLFLLWGAAGRAQFRVGTVFEGVLADLGTAVRLTHSRHRLQSGRQARVIGQTITGSRVELRVIA